MSVDKLVDSSQLDTDLTSVANAIRTKGGTSAQLAFPAGFVSAIGNIPTGGGSNEKLLASGTYTVTSAESSIAISTGISNLDTTKVRKALVVGNLSTASAGFMKWFSVVYITGPDTMTAASGTTYPKAQYYPASGTGGGIASFQNNTPGVTICYIGTNGSTITCRQFNNSYKIQPATYTWYVWGEEATA